MNDEIIQLIRQIYEDVQIQNEAVLAEYEKARQNILSHIYELYGRIGQDGQLSYQSLVANGEMERLRELTIQEINSAAVIETIVLTSLLATVYTTSFNGHAQILSKYSSSPFIMNAPNAAEKIAQPWLNETFEKRIEKHSATLISGILDSVAQLTRRNAQSSAVQNEIDKKFKTKENSSKTLFETEAAYFIGTSEEDVYSSSGIVQEVEFNAVLDSKTTKFCREHDARIYRLDDTSRPMLPAHVHCRSFYVPII